MAVALLCGCCALSVHLLYIFPECSVHALQHCVCFTDCMIGVAAAWEALVGCWDELGLRSAPCAAFVGWQLVPLSKLSHMSRGLSEEWWMLKGQLSAVLVAWWGGTSFI